MKRFLRELGALIGFGILGSAPISPYRMPVENRRWRWLAAVAAGPLSNLGLAIIFAIIIRIIGPGRRRCGRRGSAWPS